MPEKYQIAHNEKQMHFEIHDGDAIAYLEYRFYKNDIVFMHTEVPDSLSGKGVASALSAYAFEYAKKIKKQVMVYCPFVGAYLKRHPELKDQLVKEYYK
ncbi:MAG: GNAT family N-acetyltransferase [Ginsengibacter sp.]